VPVEYKNHSKSTVNLKHNKLIELATQFKQKSGKENYEQKFKKDAA